ncbi:MAG: hypothetical protein FWE82_01685 [Defluviitaleaceae bacterium]|nr:hypothetical protein [Defluviitaleaceae bacterium]
MPLFGKKEKSDPVAANQDPLALQLPVDEKTAWEYIHAPARHAFAKTEHFSNYRFFGLMYTIAAVTESGWIGFYRPHIPTCDDPLMLQKNRWKEEPEFFETIHISRVVGFDLDFDEETKVRYSSGLGGAVIGGLLGGTVGAIIGAAAAGGKAEVNTALIEVNLVINTKDFNNPQLIIPLYKEGGVSASGKAAYDTAFNALEAEVIASKGKSGRMAREKISFRVSKMFNGCKVTGETQKIILKQCADLQATLNQVLNAQQ